MTAPLWTRDEAVAATAGRAMGGDWQASGVSIDSRTIAAGDLFVALAGPNHDGHDHVKGALEAGAAAALVHKVPEGLPADAPLLVVTDTLDGLRALGAASRARSTARIVAVTGSVGKTSTKEMLKLMLEQQGETHASVGSFNNHWGVPLSLSRMPRDVRFAVFELGMNHPGEITPLTKLVRPHVAAVTTVEAVHLAQFTSVEQIADAKAEIFDGIEPNGVAVLNRDNPHYFRLRKAAEARGADVRTFGQHIDAQARLLDVAVDPEATQVFAMIGDRPLAYRIGVPGVQWAMNSLVALLTAQAAGADLEAAARSLAGMAPPKGRGERHKLALPGGGQIEVIDESYNASPVSVKAAIAMLSAAKPAKGARRIAVLGDMLELGEQSADLHKSLAAPLVERGIDQVFCAGPNMGLLFETLPDRLKGAAAADSEALAPLVRAAVRAGDVVMVKGSAGSRMIKVVKALLDIGGVA